MSAPWTPLADWLLALLFTEAVETPVYWLALRPRPWGRRLGLALGASLLTHPLVWLLVLGLGEHGYWRVVAGAEILAVAVETGYLWALSVPAAPLWALVANGLSLGLGLGSRWLWGIP